MKSHNSVILVIVLCLTAAVQSDQPQCPHSEHDLLRNMDCYPQDTCEKPTKPSFKRLQQTEWLTFKHSNCFCDGQCHLYSDCCADMPVLTDIPVLPRDTFSCHLTTGIFSSGLPIYVVDRCPDVWADEVIRDYCENMDADPRNGIFLNWFVTDEEFTLFRNMYCAVCHGRTNVTYWKVRVSCDTVVHLEGDLQSPDYASNVIQRIEDGTCIVEYDTPENIDKFVRLCKPLIETCALNWTDDCIQNMCEGENSLTSFVYSESHNKVYRNKYCAMCNNINDATCQDTITEELFHPSIGIQPVHYYPLNIIFDLNPGDGPTAKYQIGEESGIIINDTIKELRACPVQHVYDPFIGSCRFVMCRKGSIFVRGNCIPLGESLESNSTLDESCIMVQFNRSEYTLLFNGTLYLNSSHSTYDIGEYEIRTDGSALACTNLTQNYTSVYYQNRTEAIIKFSEAQGIVSIVGQIISIIALTLHLVIYSIFPKLRNLAGKCIMSLAAALLIAQFMFLIGVSFNAIDSDDHYGACAMTAIVTHLAFLCSFFWMNIMAYDICRTFTRSVNKSSNESLIRRFYKYCVYAWGVPVVVVAIAIGINFGPGSNKFKPGYGEGLCWFTNRNALFLFFALPVGSILVANTILFILTAVHIKKIKDTAKLATGNEDKKQYGLYIKLAIIMGLTWVFGFIATSTDSEVLWYFFIILNSLQGAFIFISFIFTRQVIKLLRERFSSMRHQFRRQYERAMSSEERTLSTSLSNIRKVSTTSVNAVHHKI